MAPRWAHTSCPPFILLSDEIFKFFITTAITSWLDGRHVVFGEVIEGYDIVDKIQNVDKQPGDKPTVKVVVEKSGELEKEAAADDSKEEAKPEGTHEEL